MVFAIIVLVILSPNIGSYLKTGKIDFFNLLFSILIFGIGIYIKTKRSVRKKTLRLLHSGRNVRLFSMRTIKFTEEALIIKTEFIYSELKWNSFECFKESKKLLLLFETVNQAIIIPRRIFLSPQEEYNVKSFIERKLAEAKNSVKHSTEAQ